ncbi:hypothetical protein SG0102_25100 [Intestinibaculum porci]|jgi:hypothetical protein|uniref:Uncharacterized protein n=1 Tax=Intestinibaculum porci TaxID=2487118 RepID=A0A3G9JAI1_9FIRM|nr:hypothetical protein [Intestinibaculum porci]BBH27576.1 hypothetical protein SG0102_25100 [Intestinibaculum porci]
MEEVSHHYLILIRKKQNKAFASSIYYNTEAIGGYVRKAHASRNGISSHSGSCAY